MRRLIRRLLGVKSPAEEYDAAMAHLTRCVAEGWAEGIRNPGSPDPEKLAQAMAYAEGVARRSFPALYDDEA
ncbi:hypothetical protein [Streptomyces beihaiensis]|uniref:Uncharacterized protein n=1 Tax=Streptomyces beihaiensis TaxID=2984495 RepID=A0ABT3TR92_9ACTN|nr:hypothetical protein [Streptomyces beihaiensis]MCX3059559.1 hypothetical protein [Streptomyces beihaiensis]